MGASFVLIKHGFANVKPRMRPNAGPQLAAGWKVPRLLVSLCRRFAYTPNRASGCQRFRLPFTCSGWPCAANF